MKTVKYVPEACKGEDATFEGSLELSLPSFEQKFEYLEKLNLQVGEGGEVDLGTSMEKIRYMRDMVRISKDHYVTVALKKKSTGEEYKSYDDLSYEPDAHPILIEVAGQVLNGFKVGNG